MFLIIFLVAIFVGVSLSVAANNPDLKMVAQPALAQEFAKTMTAKRLDELGVAEVTLRCKWPAKKISGQFEFYPMDGRTPVEVTGATDCAKGGNLLRISGTYSAYGRENYEVALVEAELGKLLTTAKLQPAIQNEQNEGAELLLSRRFRAAILKQGFGDVRFTCDQAKAQYHYVAVRDGHAHSGILQATCAKAHQNFQVAHSPNLVDDDRLVYVRDYNAVPLATMEQVVGEYLSKGAPASKF